MGILNKYTKPVPLGENYNNRMKNDFLILAALVAFGFCIFLLSSCSTSYKVKKAYEKAAAYSPITTKDSLNAIKIGRKVIKPEKPKLIPGKTIRVPVKSVVKVKDTAYIDKLVDSFENAMEKDANDIAQNCLDDVQSAQSKYYKKGFNDGYKKGLSEFPNDSIEVTTPDTPIPVDEEASFDLSQCELGLREAQSQVISLTAEKEIYRKQSNKWWLWLLGGLLGGAILGKFIKLSPTKLSK